MSNNRRKDENLAQRLLFTYDHQALSAGENDILYTVPAGRKLVIKRVSYNNPTGLATQATNYITVAIKNGSTVIASRNNHTGAGGSIGAAAAEDLTLAAVPANVLAAGDKLSFDFAIAAGSPTLPIGRVWIDADLY